MGEGSLVAKNPSAGRDYHLIETVEAGLELKGSEVKSLRDHRVSLRDAFARIEKGQAWLYGMEITPYKQAGPSAPDSKRFRRLLLHRAEIARLESKVVRKGFTLVATRLYFKGPYAKVEIALAQGKQAFDKRETIKEREADRDMARALKMRKRG